jgi:hypothetical protein
VGEVFKLTAGNLALLVLKLHHHDEALLTKRFG